MMKDPLCADQDGFSLTETVIGVAVLALVAAGVASTTMLTSRIANQNIHENTAYMVAQAYAEQIKSIGYNDIRLAMEDPLVYDIPTESLRLGEGLSAAELKKADPLIFGVRTEKRIVIDVDRDDSGDLRERTMRMWITPRCTDLSSDTDCWDSIEIALDFEWEVYNGSGMERKSGMVRLVKTNVSEY